MTKSCFFVWPLLITWMCSGLIHLSDPGVGGIKAILEPLMFVSITVIGLVILLPILLCQLAFYHHRWLGFLSSFAVVAVGMGLLMMVAQQGTGVTTSLLSFWRPSVFFGAVIIVSSLPFLWTSRNFKKSVELCA